MWFGRHNMIFVMRDRTTITGLRALRLTSVKVNAGKMWGQMDKTGG